MNPRLGFLLGRVPGPGSLLPDVLERLEAAGVEVTVAFADAASGYGNSLPRALLGSDVVVLRALGQQGIRSAHALEQAGVRLCNAASGTALLRDKPALSQALAAAGLPLPAQRVIGDWADVIATAMERSVVVKPPGGSRGEGVLTPAATLPVRPPYPGPYLVEEWLAGDGADRKLYVVGWRVAGVRRRWPPRTLEDKLGSPFEPDSQLREIALAAGATLGLELYGVDVVVGPTGPAIVDVNGFPGYKGVPAAAHWIAEHLTRAARLGAEAVDPGALPCEP